MAIFAAFQPAYGSGITETASTTSAQYTIDPATKRSGGGSKAVMVSNLGDTNGVYVRVGTGTITATEADLYVAPGKQFILSKAETDDQIAFLAAASTSAMHAIPGEGFSIG
jgi:hypothetical protein